MLFDFDAALRRMPRTFDSHDFIRVWSRDNQKPYIKFLSEQTGEKPFMSAHSKIARELNQYSKQVRQAGKVTSADIFGEQARCMSWQKLH